MGRRVVIIRRKPRFSRKYVCGVIKKRYGIEATIHVIHDQHIFTANGRAGTPIEVFTFSDLSLEEWIAHFVNDFIS